MKKKSLIPHEANLRCAKLTFFPWCGFRDTEVQSFSFFPIWLPHHVTDDVMILIQTFYMDSRSDGENFVSIRQAVAEKNTRSVRANKQTDRQTDPHARPFPPVRVKRIEVFLSIQLDAKCSVLTNYI